MPITLPYDVEDQVIILPLQNQGCTNFTGTITDINRTVCCYTDPATGVVNRVHATKYTVMYWAHITNVCDPQMRECVQVCKDFCEDEIELLTTPVAL